jgi:hypothetical protein
MSRKSLFLFSTDAVDAVFLIFICGQSNLQMWNLAETEDRQDL